MSLSARPEDMAELHEFRALVEHDPFQRATHAVLAQLCRRTMTAKAAAGAVLKLRKAQAQGKDVPSNKALGLPEV